MFNKSQIAKDQKKAKQPKSLPRPKDVDYVSKMGYRDDSPFNKRPYIDINTPNGVIDMSNTGTPLMANGVYLPPYSGQHQFNTTKVRETPVDGQYMELTDDEIAAYKAGGYVVEELSSYKDGGTDIYYPPKHNPANSFAVTDPRSMSSGGSYVQNQITHFQSGGNMDPGNNALELHMFYDKNVYKKQNGGNFRENPCEEGYEFNGADCIPITQPVDINQQILTLADSVSGGGYNKKFAGSGVPKALVVNDYEMLPAATEGTYCSGFTCWAATETMREQGLLKDMTAEQLKKFQQTWYGAEGFEKGKSESLSTKALEDFGLGKAVSREEATAGDIAQIWRNDGSGHSVIFKDWVKDDQGNITGIKYRSSQGSTDGIGDRTEMFKERGINPDKIYVGRIGKFKQGGDISIPDLSKFQFGGGKEARKLKRAQRRAGEPIQGYTADPIFDTTTELGFKRQQLLNQSLGRPEIQADPWDQQRWLMEQNMADEEAGLYEAPLLPQEEVKSEPVYDAVEQIDYGPVPEGVPKTTEEYREFIKPSKDITYKKLSRPVGDIVLKREMTDDFAKALNDNGYYVNKLYTGDYEVIPNKDIADIIYKAGFFDADNLSSKFQLGDKETLQQHFQPIFNSAQSMHAKRNVEKIDNLISQGYTKDEAIKELARQGEGVVSTLTNLYGNYAEATYQKNKAEADALTALGVTNIKDLTEYQKKQLLNVAAGKANAEAKLGAVQDEAAFLNTYMPEVGESTAYRGFMGVDLNGQPMYGTTGYDVAQTDLNNAKRAATEIQRGELAQLDAAKALLTSDKLTEEQKKEYLENSDKFNQLYQSYLGWLDAGQTSLDINDRTVRGDVDVADLVEAIEAYNTEYYDAARVDPNGPTHGGWDAPQGFIEALDYRFFSTPEEWEKYVNESFEKNKTRVYGSPYEAYLGLAGEKRESQEMQDYWASKPAGYMAPEAIQSSDWFWQGAVLAPLTIKPLLTGISNVLGFSPVSSMPWLNLGSAIEADMAYQAFKDEGFVDQAIQNFKEGNYWQGAGNAALGALGLIGPLKMVAGMNARTNTALELIKSDASFAETFANTARTQTADGSVFYQGSTAGTDASKLLTEASQSVLPVSGASKEVSFLTSASDVGALDDVAKSEAAVTNQVEAAMAGEIPQASFDAGTGTTVGTGPRDFTTDYLYNIDSNLTPVTSEELFTTIASNPSAEIVDVTDAILPQGYYNAADVIAAQEEALNFGTNVADRWAFTDKEKYFSLIEEAAQSSTKLRTEKLNLLDKRGELYKKLADEFMESKGLLEKYKADPFTRDIPQETYIELNKYAQANPQMIKLNEELNMYDDMIANIPNAKMLEAEQYVDPIFKQKVQDMYTAAGKTMPENINMPKSDTKLVQFNEADPSFKALSKEAQEFLKANKTIGGVRMGRTGEAISIGSKAEKDARYYLSETPQGEKEILRVVKQNFYSPTWIDTIAAHEQRHVGQDAYNWLELVNKYNPEYGFKVPHTENELAKEFSKYIINPQKTGTPGTKDLSMGYTLDTYRSSIGELDADLMMARKAVVKDWMQKYGFSMDEAVQMVKEQELAGDKNLYELYLNNFEANLNVHFKADTPFDIKKKLLQILPAATVIVGSGAALGAASGSSGQSQQKRGGTIPRLNKFNKSYYEDELTDAEIKALREQGIRVEEV
jgi:hypothetical protein